MFSSLAERDFRRLFTGSVFSQFGFWMLFVGQGWLIFKELGGSAFQRYLPKNMTTTPAARVHQLLNTSP